MIIRTIRKMPFLQAVGSVCRQAGHRFGEHVERVMPLVLAYAKVEDDELREHCLQACKFESGRHRVTDSMYAQTIL